ncbi:MAG: DUF2079 domain-containing protein [Ardenticatenaceae bacterium]|nr:DUF2079 domain-containing protein [Anaerolineales bacterium]MCB8921418.1 DUF2079 domain-containing protein [Ardenticatenaceae bacterium]MCB8991535.1 DUF2079 domain-containing protein [Ardenticatenaceae bacterium]MCB9005104.1 DUF2079 domain-containing protein [Ardenticatenaceae bacterium]
MLQKIKQNTKLVPVLFALLFVGTFFWLNGRQYLSFQVQAPDADRFSQAIWNTMDGGWADGRFLYTTITQNSVLSNHFSPYLAFLAPLLFIWEDARILYLVQVIGIAATGLILYKIVADKRPKLALWFLLAFYLNPNLHSITLYELRRITLAMPFLALAIYGIYSKKRKWLLIGIFFALLCKEEVGVIVFAIGLFLLIFRRDWRWGVPMMLLGAGWFFLMLQVVIPAMGKGTYPPLNNYYGAWGSSVPDILLYMITHPLQVLQTMFDQSSLQAIGRALLPVAFILPLLAADYLFMIVPLVVVMLLSAEPAMHTLSRWYMASVLPFLFVAVGIGLTRIPKKWGQAATAVLFGSTLLAYTLYSPAPLGGKYKSYLYQMDERDEKAWQLIAQIPDDAAVMAQVAFTPQLSYREHLYIFPWVSAEREVDYVLLASGFASYPIDPADLDWEIYNEIADPAYTVRAEVDGIYLLERGGNPLPSVPVNQVAEDAIKLERVGVAVTDEDGFYQPVDGETAQVQPGQTMRVSLYWEALDAPDAERTVSVRLADENGYLIAQQDSLPGQSSRPTSWWEEGWYFRDVYYLQIPEGTAVTTANLNVLLYDSFTQERVPFDDKEKLTIIPVEIKPAR